MFVNGSFVVPQVPVATGVLPARGMGGLGADCGDDPCTWWDQVWVRDPCLAYLRCATPNDPRVIAMDHGIVAGLTSEAADMAGSALTSVGTNAGTAVGQTLQSTIAGIFENPDGTTNWLVVGVTGAAVIAAVQILGSVLGGRR